MAVGTMATTSLSNQQAAKMSSSDRFADLVNALRAALGPSSGLTCDDVDVGFLTHLMQEYDASDSGWQKFALGDASRGYTRNLVDEGNGKSNLVRRLFPLSLPFPPFSRPFGTNRTVCETARPSLVPGQRLPHPRPRQRALPDEDPSRRADRDAVRVPFSHSGRGGATADEGDIGKDVHRGEGGVHGRRARGASHLEPGQRLCCFLALYVSFFLTMT